MKTAQHAEATRDRRANCSGNQAWAGQQAVAPSHLTRARHRPYRPRARPPRGPFRAAHAGSSRGTRGARLTEHQPESRAATWPPGTRRAGRACPRTVRAAGRPGSLKNAIYVGKSFRSAWCWNDAVKALGKLRFPWFDRKRLLLDSKRGLAQVEITFGWSIEWCPLSYRNSPCWSPPHLQRLWSHARSR
jgi:hypothetical protein